MLEKEEIVKTDDAYVTVTDMETFDYVEGRILITSEENVKGHLYSNLSVYYYGVFYVDSPTGEEFVPQPETSAASHALYYRFYDVITSTLKELFFDLLKISPKSKKEFSISLNEPYCKVTPMYKSIVVEVVFRYQVFAYTDAQKVIQAQTRGTDPTRTFIRDSSMVAREWANVLRERIPTELSTPESATKFFSETFSILKRDAKVTKIEHSVDISFILFDFIPENPPAPPLHVAEYWFGFPASKEFGNTLRRMKRDVEGVLRNISVYLSLLRSEEALRSVVEITDSHIQQAQSFPNPMLFGRPYAIYKEFVFNEEMDIFEIPERILDFLKRRMER